MRSKSNKIIVVYLLSSMLMCGCSKLPEEMNNAMKENKDIKLSIEDTHDDSTKHSNIEWIELDQLKTFENIRKTWDKSFDIVKFDIGSKNGCIYVDTDGKWNGNNTLYNAFQNKKFVNDYWKKAQVITSISDVAKEQFSDIKSEKAGLIASVNAYFNIIPTALDGTSGLNNKLTRAEAMSALYRCDTPVRVNDNTEDKLNEFENIVGKNDCNKYAINMMNDSFFTIDNKCLNKYTYNSNITRAEAVYMIVHRYYEDELKNESRSIKVSFDDCKDAGDVLKKQKINKGYAWQAYELEYCLQQPDEGISSDLYKALTIAKRHGIIGSETRWNSPLVAGEFMQMIINTYSNMNNESSFAVNSSFGENDGNSLLKKETQKENDKNSQEIETNKVENIKEADSIDKLLEEYGKDLIMSEEEIDEVRKNSEGFTFEYVDMTMLVSCSWLNVRTGPSTDFSIIKCVPKDTKAHIVGRCIENGWYRVIADGKICYQCGLYFKDCE